jgi:hypothetical protein
MKLLYQGLRISNFHSVNGFDRVRQYSLPLDVGLSQRLSSKLSPPDLLVQRAPLPRRWQFNPNFSLIRASTQSLQTSGATSQTDSTSTLPTPRAITFKTQRNAVIINKQHIDQTVLTDQQNSHSSADSSTRSGFISVPVGSFAGTLERIIRIRDGRPVPADTGDQGGGQN